MSDIPTTRLYPPVWFAVALVIEWLLDRWWPLQQIVAHDAQILGWFFIGLGVMVVIWAAGLFHKHGTEIKPFHESSKLVIQGPFRYTRNPMYMGMVFALTGFAIWMGSLAAFLVIPAFIVFITRRFIIYEERMLEEKFGDEYRDYRMHVSRWI